MDGRSADIIILGSITAFEPEAGGLGVGGGGLLPGMLGGIKFGKKDAYISMDLRLVDVRTRRIISTTTVDGKASSFNVGGLGVGWGGAGILGAGLSVYKNTPMEKAVRVMIEKAVNYIASQIPSEYYRYSPEGTKSPEAGPSPAGPAGKLKRPAVAFKPGDILLFSEDFSTCEEVPAGFSPLTGKVECVELGGKRWIVNVTPESRISKALNLKGDFAIEFDVYSSGKGVEPLDFRFGKTGKGETLRLRLRYYKDSLFEIYFPEPDEKVGTTSTKTVHRVAIQQKGDRWRLFVDGRRIVTAEVDPVVASKNRDGFVIIQRGDMEKGQYFLISNLKVTRY
ncbi:MAG: CsgG/HfaB family protein [Nitrospirota bacterium]|nr:CsgG/HfaB family protein [Nitrospirota bacterium]